MEAVNPEQFLVGLVGKKVLLKLKWGPAYTGLLLSSDSHMNIQLDNACEVDPASGEETLLGEVVFR